MENILDRFSQNFKKSLKSATILAMELNHEQIEPQHILYGLSLQRGSVGAEIFTALSAKPTDIKNCITKMSNSTGPSPSQTKVQPQFAETSKKIIQKAIATAYINKHSYVGTEHLLAGLTEINDETIKQIFKTINISEDSLNKQLVSVLKSISKLPDLTETFKTIHKRHSKNSDDETTDDPDDLDGFGVNLTSPAMQKTIDPVIGRDDEINRIIQILSRRSKNNPLLLGEPGVGKTAICEGLAKKITEGNVPEILKDKKIYSLDLTGMLAGTMYRGEFESRIKKVIEEAKSRPEMILFIDEIHNIVGAGSTSGSLDAANILKPALARGEIRCIGATTFTDYRKHIENDPALERRFQTVKINEPSLESTKNILRGIKTYFEKFHRVEITDSAIVASVELSQKYLPEKFFPDKAIDLIDEASSKTKMDRKPSKIERDIKNLALKLAEIQNQKEDAVIDEKYEEAFKLKQTEDDLLLQLGALEKQIQNDQKYFDVKIDQYDIAKVITKMTGIPAEDLILSEKKKILNLHKHLGKQVIGQEKAIGEVAEMIKRAKAGLSPDKKPLASFVFVGPSGVGKTYLAKIISQQLFGGADNLIKIDMSEYGEKFNISKLIGAPAGYVGYKESGQLTEKVKRNPYSVVLLDEIEKANSEVFNLLLQILDEGSLTDASGTKIDFTNTVMIMTSNIGSELVGDARGGLGFGATAVQQNIDKQIIAKTKKLFKPELINRLDKIVYFNPLTTSDLQKIAKLELEKLNSRLGHKNINFNYDHNILKLIATKSNRVEGARAINKIIQSLLEAPLADKILADEIGANSSVQAYEKNGIIKLSIK